IHARAIDVEIAQGDVFEAVHLVETAQEGFVIDLGGAVDGAVVVGMVLFGGGVNVGGAQHRGGGGGDDFLNAGVHCGFEHVEGAGGENVMGKTRFFGALGDADCGLVEENVDAGHGLGDFGSVADVALDNGDIG